MTTLKFEKQAQSPDWTRVTIRGTRVLDISQDSGTYDVSLGTSVIVNVETKGNPGNTATILVTNSSTPMMTLRIPDDAYMTLGKYKLWATD